MKFLAVLFLVVFSFPVFSGSLSGKKVLFDATHAQGAGNSDWFIDTSYSDWADALEAEGAEVNSIEDSWDLRLFMDFDVVIIPEPQIPFTDNEKYIIRELLKSKKGVFFLSNGGSIDSNGDGANSPKVLNTILSEYGITNNTDNLNGNPLKTKSFTNSGFVTDSERISCWNASTFSGSVKPAITDDKGKTILGYAETGSGRLLLCGDADMFGDGFGTSGDTLYNDFKLGTHKDISVKAVKFLAFLLNPVVIEEPADDNDTPSDTDGLYAGITNLSGYELVSALKRFTSKNKSLGYTEARNHMFKTVDNYNGRVDCVYTNVFLTNVNSIPNNTAMNCEHSWPQSHFTSSESGTKKGDLHHLYPADSKANSRRSNHPFGKVVNVTWEQDGSKLGSDASGRTVFEPRDSHKGNVARSLFYFSVRYGQPIDRYEEEALREWMKIDPVDSKERARCDKVEKIQNNRNPFVDHPEFVEKIADF